MVAHRMVRSTKRSIEADSPRHGALSGLTIDIFYLGEGICCVAISRNSPSSGRLVKLWMKANFICLEKLKHRGFTRPLPKVPDTMNNWWLGGDFDQMSCLVLGRSLTF